MKTNIKKWGEANRAEERKEFAGKVQMPKVLRGNLTRIL